MPSSRDKQKEYFKHYYWKNRERRLLQGKMRHIKFRMMMEVLKSQPCMDCGKTFPSYCMHFDHKDQSSKLACVGRMVGMSCARIIKEARKCDIVCANCHAKRTWKNQSLIGRCSIGT